MVTSARASATENACEVTCAIAEKRHCFAVESSEYKFANLTIWHGFECLRVNDFHDIIVLPEVKTILLFTFKSHTRAAHFWHTEGIISFYAQHFLDTLTLLLRMRLCSDGEHLEFGVATWVNAQVFHHLMYASDVWRDGMNGSSAKVAYKLYLSQSVASSGWNGEHTESLSA